MGVITKGAHMRPAYKVACPQGMICQVLTSTIQGTIIGSENRLEIHLIEKQGPCFYCQEFCSFCEDFIGTYDPTFLLGCISLLGAAHASGYFVTKCTEYDGAPLMPFHQS